MKVGGRSRTCADCYCSDTGNVDTNRLLERIHALSVLCCPASCRLIPHSGGVHVYNRISFFGKWAALGCTGPLHGIMRGIYLYQVKLCFRWYSYITMMITLTRMYLCVCFSVIIYLLAVTIVGK